MYVLSCCRIGDVDGRGDDDLLAEDGAGAGLQHPGLPGTVAEQY